MIRYFLTVFFLLYTPICGAQENFPFIVLGAGPAGLSSAIELAVAGVENILVIEKRQPMSHLDFSDFENIEILSGKNFNHPWGSRQRNVAMDERAMDRLKKLGVDLPFFPIEGIHFEDGQNRLSGYLRFGSNMGTLMKAFLGRDFAAAASLSEIEQALLERASQYPQIKILFGAETKVHEDRVSLTHLSENREYFFRNLVIGSGANSQFLEGLGFLTNPLEGTKREIWQVGNFRYSSKISNWLPGYHFGCGKSVNHLGFHLAIDAGGGLITVYVNGTNIKDGQKALLEAQRALNVPGELESVGRFESAPKELYAVDGLTDPRILPIGDARFSHDPALGGGVSTAIRISQALGASIHQGELNLTDFRSRIAIIRNEWEILSKWPVIIRKVVRKASKGMSFFGRIFSEHPPTSKGQQRLIPQFFEKTRSLDKRKSIKCSLLFAS